MSAFDPYHKWLGISPPHQPPNHYRLLGVELYEADPEIIDLAASRQMTLLRQVANGPHVKESQKLLNEVAAARLCLLKPAEKARYDAALKASLTAATIPGAQPTPQIGETVDDAAENNPLDFDSLQDSQGPASPNTRQAGKWPGALGVAVGSVSILLLCVAAGVYFGSGSRKPAPQQLPEAIASDTEEVENPEERIRPVAISDRQPVTIGSRNAETVVRQSQPEPLPTEPESSDGIVTDEPTQIAASLASTPPADSPGTVEQEPAEMAAESTESSPPEAKEKPANKGLLQAKKKFSAATAKAGKALLLQFDVQLDRLSKMKLGKQFTADARLKLIDAVKAEQRAFQARRFVPWSLPMRRPLLEYMESMRKAEDDLQGTFDKLILAETKGRDDAAAKELAAEKRRALDHHVVGIWHCNGITFRANFHWRLYSNGRVNDPEGVAVWFFDKNSDLVLNLPNPEGPKGVFIDRCAISEDGTTFQAKNQVGGKYSARKGD